MLDFWWYYLIKVALFIASWIAILSLIINENHTPTGRVDILKRLKWICWLMYKRIYWWGDLYSATSKTSKSQCIIFSSFRLLVCVLSVYKLPNTFALIFRHREYRKRGFCKTHFSPIFWFLVISCIFHCPAIANHIGLLISVAILVWSL